MLDLSEQTRDNPIGIVNRKGKSFLIFYFISFLFFISLVSALQDDLSFSVGSEFDLKRACFNRGFFCDSGFECNITLVYPDGNSLIENQVMTFNPSFRNITITQAQNNQLGFIQAISTCNNGTDAGADTFEIAITGDGNKFQEFPPQFFLIIVGIILVVIGVFNERLRMFKHLGAVLFMVLGTLTLYPGYNFINWTTLLGKAIGFIFIALGFYFLIEDAFSRDNQDNTFEQETQGGYYDE